MPCKNRKLKILTVFGTRPEAIKLAPVVRELAAHADRFESRVGLTGQHDDLLKQMIELFQIKADFNLKVMQPNQSLAELTANILKELNGKLEEIKPDVYYKMSHIANPYGDGTASRKIVNILQEVF